METSCGVTVITNPHLNSISSHTHTGSFTSRKLQLLLLPLTMTPLYSSVQLVWQWASIQHTTTLKLKQLDQIRLLFTLVLFPPWHVKMSLRKRPFLLSCVKKHYGTWITDWPCKWGWFCVSGYSTVMKRKSKTSQSGDIWQAQNNLGWDSLNGQDCVFVCRWQKAEISSQQGLSMVILRTEHSVPGLHHTHSESYKSIFPPYSSYPLFFHSFSPFSALLLKAPRHPPPSPSSP